MSDLKQQFIYRALAENNDKLISRIKIIAARAGIGVTGEGLQSLAYKIATSGPGAASQLSFKEYLRFVDMGAGRGHKLGGLKNTLVTLQASNKKGLAQMKDNTRKPKTFLYSKPAYGLLTSLQNNLLHGFTEEGIQILKTELKIVA